jgi:hypothetical protein
MVEIGYIYKVTIIKVGPGSKPPTHWLKKTKNSLFVFQKKRICPTCSSDKIDLCWKRLNMEERFSDPDLNINMYNKRRRDPS